MSKGLKTTIALGGTMLAIMAAGSGAIAQCANDHRNAAGQHGVEWDLGGPDPMAITWPGEERPHASCVTVEEQNQPTSATGDVGDASPKRKVRSGE
jgi:hypothetical protein